MRPKSSLPAPKKKAPVPVRGQAAHEIRIIGGQWRRTPIKVLDKPGLRPTPDRVRETLKLRAFGLLKIPMLFFVGPVVEEASDEKIVVKIGLNRRTRNHVGSMYFGVLAAGADCACGLLAMRLIDERAGGKVSLIFKDFKAEFLKRAEGDVLFTCTEGVEILDAVKKSQESGERQSLPVNVIATVPSRLGDEPVARFVLTLSLKSQ